MVNLRAISAQLGPYYPYLSSQWSTSCWWVVLSIRPLLAVGVLGGSLLVSWFPSARVSKVFGETNLLWQAMSLGAFSLPPGSISPLQRRFFGVIFPSIRRDFFLFTYLPIFCILGEVKIEVNKNFKVWLDILLIGFYSPCHVVTLNISVSSMLWAWARW